MIRDPRRGRESGFTLVELLVVVIVIGVLASIAIPVYVNVQKNAKDASARSDLASAKTAVSVEHARSGTWPALSATDGTVNRTLLKSSGWAGTTVLDDSTTSGGSPNAFCLVTTSASGTRYYATESSAPTDSKPSGCR